MLLDIKFQLSIFLVILSVGNESFDISFVSPYPVLKLMNSLQIVLAGFSWWLPYTFKYELWHVAIFQMCALCNGLHFTSCDFSLCVCVVYGGAHTSVCSCRGQSLTSAVFLYCCPLYVLRQGLLQNLECAHLTRLATKPLEFSCLHLPGPGSDVYTHHFQFFPWVFGNWTQVFTFAQHVQNHLLSAPITFS